jgi:hypothetical protein
MLDSGTKSFLDSRLNSIVDPLWDSVDKNGADSCLEQSGSRIEVGSIQARCRVRLDSDQKSILGLSLNFMLESTSKISWMNWGWAWIELGEFEVESRLWADFNLSSLKFRARFMVEHFYLCGTLANTAIFMHKHLLNGLLASTQIWGTALLWTYKYCKIIIINVFSMLVNFASGSQSAISELPNIERCTQMALIKHQ